MHEPQHNTHYLIPHSPPCIPQNSHNSPSLAFSLRFLTPSLFCVPTLFRYICQQQWLVVHLSMPFFFVCSCLCLSGGSFSFSSLVCDDEISGHGHFQLTGLEAKDLVFISCWLFWVSWIFLWNVFVWFVLCVVKWVCLLCHHPLPRKVVGWCGWLQPEEKDLAYFRDFCFQNWIPFNVVALWGSFLVKTMILSTLF